MGKFNNIKIHQAYYGEVSRSHGCLSSTVYDNDLKSFLTAFTDRPTSIPAGIDLQPYYSGKSYGNYFVFTLTMPAPNASRGGMVFTHALIINSKDLNSISNLAELFTLFVSAVPEAMTEFILSPFELSVSEQTQAIGTVQQYIQQTIGKLVENKTPILFCGDLNAFRNTIFAIWQGLAPTFRKKFSFTAGFSIDRLDQSNTIIHFQKNLIKILKTHDFVSDDLSDKVTITSEVEQYVLNASADNAFESFLKVLGIVPNDWSLLSSSVKAFQLYSKLESEISVDETRLLTRMLGNLAPSPERGSKIKTILLQKLNKNLITGIDTNLKALRNLPLMAFESGIEIVTNAIDVLLNKQFANQLPFDVSVTGEICLISLHKENRNWWHEAVSYSLRKIGSQKEEAVVSQFWLLLSQSKIWIHPVLSFIPDDLKYEQIYIQQLPKKLDGELSQDLANAVVKRNWFLLHAHLLLYFLVPREAVVKQLQTEGVNSTNSGISFLFSKIIDSDLLDLTLSLKKRALIDEAGKRSVSRPTMLMSLDVENPTWLEIWSVSLDKTKKLQYGIQDVDAKISTIIRSIKSGKTVPNNIVEYIAESSFADLSNVTNRKEMWLHLPSQTKPKFLAATAAGYLKHLIAGTLTSSELEGKLHSELTRDTFVANFLNKYHNEIGPVLTFYENVSGLKDSFLADFIRYYKGPISELESSRLGSLVLAKKLFKILVALVV